MAMTRRGFIRTLGGTGVVLAAGSVGLARCDTMPETAVAPWREAGASRTDPREWVLAHALLAPNPHNIQPWLADLREPGVITLRLDPARLLPQTDPHGRQLLIGHGTFLELLDLAARERGLRADMTLYPDGAAAPQASAAEVARWPVARIELHADAGVSPDPLFPVIPLRRSCKTPYAPDRPFEDIHVAALRAVHRDPGVGLHLAPDGALPATLRRLTRDAMLLEMQTPRLLEESIRLTRIGARAIARNPDGIDLHGPMFWWMSRFGLMTHEKAMTPGTLAYQGGLDYALGWAGATPSFGWLTTPGNDRRAQIAAGRAYVRLNLQATASGVAMHPVSQLLQEYPEMAELQRAFRAVTGTADGDTVQMLFRLGYADVPGPSPRRPLAALLTA